MAFAVMILTKLSHSVQFWCYLLYWILFDSIKECTRYGQNFIYAFKCLPIFMNLTLVNTIVCRSFPNFTQISQDVWRIWVYIHLYVEENTALTELIITKLWLVWHFIVVNSCTEFCENLTDCLVTDTVSQTDWQMDMVPT